MAHWILQNNLYSEEGFESLTSALDRLGSAYSVHKCIPFVGTLEPEAEPPPGRPVIVMGSYTLANHAKARGWTPGAWLDGLDFIVQRNHWGKQLLNEDSWTGCLRDAQFQPDLYFVRPVEDTKSFTGQVMDYGEFANWRKSVLALPDGSNATVTGDTIIQVCSKKEIWSETRVWIVDRKVVTCSGYKLGTLKRYSPPEMVDDRIQGFAQCRAADWSPNQAYVMDVAETPEGLKIVEVNNLNSAGFYKGDMNKLVMALEDLVNG